MLLVNVGTDLSMLLQLDLYALFPAAAQDEVGRLKKKLAVEMQGLQLRSCAAAVLTTRPLRP
jgi:hypothetical protein